MAQAPEADERTSATRRATCSGGVCGTMPWPEIEDERRAAHGGPRLRDAIFKPGSAGDEQKRIEIALHGEPARG